MKNTIRKLFPLLLCLILLLSLVPAALAEDAGAPQESILDEEALDQWIRDYLSAHGIGGGNQIFSVGFCYTATGDCWYYNGDAFMYSASMYKVPVSMLLAEKEASGELSQDSQLPGGTLKYLESSALTFSDNDAGHAMLAYLGADNSGKCSDKCMRYSSLPREYYDQDFFDYSYYSARFITEVMATLCEGGEERFPHILENLLLAQPDSYLNLSLMGKYRVAQKYGAFKERNGNDNNHITGIIYTPTPIVVTVMTRNVGNYMNRMAEIGEYLADYSLELDEKLALREQQALEAAAQEAESENEAQSAPSGRADLTARAGARIEGGREKLMPAFYLLWAAILVFAGMVLVHALKTRRKKLRVRH